MREKEFLMKFGSSLEIKFDLTCSYGDSRMLTCTCSRVSKYIHICSRVYSSVFTCNHLVRQVDS